MSEGITTWSSQTFGRFSSLSPYIWFRPPLFWEQHAHFLFSLFLKNSGRLKIKDEVTAVLHFMMLGNQTVLIFSYFCFLPDPTTTPLPKGELITIHNIYRSLCCSYIVLRWTQETLLHFLTIQTRNNALNHLENFIFSLDIYTYIYIYIYR